jgi:SAM-dependent methyltransferase
MAVYDDFAWFYDRYWNEEYHSAALPILERIWLPRVASGARILDVCCGSGYLASLLAARGYRVTGFDASAAMIDHARRRAPDAHFLVAEAPEFRTRTKFDAAVSTFDSLNHILDPAALAAAFRRVAAALKPGAAFAFDVLLEAAYRTNWADHFSIVRDDHALILSGGGFDFRSRLARCGITMFRLVDGAWRRSDAEVWERCYSAGEIDDALRDAGFEAIACYDAHDLGMAGQLGEGRVFYVAETKKGAGPGPLEDFMNSRTVKDKPR